MGNGTRVVGNGPPAETDPSVEAVPLTIPITLLDESDMCNGGGNLPVNYSVASNVPMLAEVDSKGEIPEREKWDKRIEFMLSCMGFCIGLGNVWRFPYLCYKNGGGAFLIPYFLCVICGGVPMYFLEVGLGQFMSEGGITVWKICPIFKGVGFGATVILTYLNIYYIIILAWTIFFFFASFASELPWATCNNPWNTEHCFTVGQNLTLNHSERKVDAAVEYWENRVLAISGGIEEVGSIRWELAGCLAIAWILCYFCIWKGVKSTGKVVYFTATFPYIMMTVILVRGVTLDGAWDGLLYYLRPDFSQLLKAQVWIDACTQIFFSYAVALGAMIALGSYNKFNNNFVKDCTMICSLNSVTSLYAGVLIFSVLGFMAKQQGVPISEVAESGPGLAFIAYPKAVAQMPLAPLWSVLFFFMILVLGIDSQFVAVEGFVTGIVDLYPHVLRVGNNRPIFIAIISFISFLFGLTMVTNGGMYVFQLFDYYSASGMVLLWFCFFEAFAVSWVYGADRFYDNIQMMVGFRPGPWLKLCWMIFTPSLTMGILLFSILEYEPLKYNKIYQYPGWAEALGWSFAISSMVVIPAYFFWTLFSYPGTLSQKWRRAIYPELKPELLRPQDLLEVPPKSLNKAELPS